jgi:hypothetical protein
MIIALALNVKLVDARLGEEEDSDRITDSEPSDRDVRDSHSRGLRHSHKGSVASNDNASDDFVRVMVGFKNDIGRRGARLARDSRFRYHRRRRR